ncbi:UNVERIFIED_ORG: hypothetical protein ABIB52_003344 [Arthrobacter sp. UYCu721]
MLTPCVRNSAHRSGDTEKSSCRNDSATLPRHAGLAKAAYGETPYNYLMTRRIERAMALLRAGASVTDACMEVGSTSLGSFSSRFTEIVGMTPSAYRARGHHAVKAMPSCIARQHTRPARKPSRIRFPQVIGEPYKIVGKKCI